MKKNFLLLLSISLIVVCALSSAAAPPVIVPKQLDIQNTETVNASFDEVYNAFIKYFNDKGYTLKTTDNSAGSIVTNDIQITDEYVVSYYVKQTGDRKELLEKGMNLGYCDCGLPEWRLHPIKLYYRYTVDITKISDKSTQFGVKAAFWTELYKESGLVKFYKGNWDCASTGVYEKQVIDDIKTNYLKKK
jgi:hypothetical protein